MAEVIVFPDAVAVTVSALSSALSTLQPTVAVHASVPFPERPEKFVTVERAGGPQRNFVVDSATIAVDAWAPLAQDAHDIAQTCRAVLHSLPGTVVGGAIVYRCDEIGGPVHQPDPESGQERYTFAVQLSLRGSAI